MAKKKPKCPFNDTVRQQDRFRVNKLTEHNVNKHLEHTTKQGLVGLYHLRGQRLHESAQS